MLALLRDALRSGSGEQRKMVIYCLRDLAAGDASTFLPALDDADRGVRLAALAALVRLPSLDHSSIDRVIASMQTDGDGGVRRAAAASAKRIAERDSYAAELLARVPAAGSTAPATKRREP